MTTLAVGTDTFSVFGTTATLLVSEAGLLDDARAIADTQLAAVDLACSRFRPDSELSRLNGSGGAVVPVSKLFAELVEAALRAARLTDGDVDPTCGQALEEIGYDRDFAVLQAAGARSLPSGPAPVSVPGWRCVRLDAKRGLVQLTNGAQLDLGATAKAWAADRCASLIAAKTDAGVLVSLGGDIAVAGPVPRDGRVAGAGHRRPRRRAGRAGADGDDTFRRARHVEHHGAHLGRGWPARAPHHQPGHRTVRRLLLADGQRGGRQLHRRQHREHRGDHPQRGRAALAAGGLPAQPAGAAGRNRRDHRRLAERPRPGLMSVVAAAGAVARGGAAPHGLPPAAIIVTSSTPLWYLTRATGLVALVLLTLSMAFGLLSSVRYQRPALPRFVTIGLHRSMSLLALAFTLIHIVTTLADSFVPIHLQDVVIPFISAYRPVWLGLGAIAFDLMLALTVTSLLRTRMSYRSWRLVHWTSYLCWPVAVVHGLGTGTDTPVHWVLGLTVACVAVIAVLTGWRLAYGWPSHAGARLLGALALVLTLIAGGAWLTAGPLQPGWARRAGTPVHVAKGSAKVSPAPSGASGGAR